MYRCQVSNATDISVHVTGSGYAHEFYSNHIRTNVEDATAAFQTECNRTIVVGGEIASRPTETPPHAIRFYNPGPGPAWGGYVYEPGMEGGSGIEIDGAEDSNGFNMVHLENVGHTMSTDEGGGLEYLVRFGNTRGSKLVDPAPMGLFWEEEESVLDKPLGDLVRWSAEAEDCGVVADAAALTLPKARGTSDQFDGYDGSEFGPVTGHRYTDEGSRNPYVIVDSAVTPEQLAVMPTGVPTYVPFGTDTGAPLVHDGEEWYSFADALSPYSPTG
jgi:hypothetical protein